MIPPMDLTGIVAACLVATIARRKGTFASSLLLWPQGVHSNHPTLNPALQGRDFDGLLETRKKLACA